MLKRVLLLSLTLIIASCAYTSDKSIQEVTILTPGANNAQCFLYSGGLKYDYRPPQTLNVAKSEEDLVVDCKAPGNRRRKVVIEPVISNAILFNTFNGVAPGMLWDYASKSIYSFPPVIEVDFRGMPTKPFPVPAQNQPDIRQPEDYDLEEFRPGVPRLNEDRHAPALEIQKRRPPESFDLFSAEAEAGAAGQSADHVIGNTSSSIEVPVPVATPKPAPAGTPQRLSGPSSDDSSRESSESSPAESSETSSQDRGGRARATQAPTPLLQ